MKHSLRASRLPRSVLALGFVSLFMDASSEMVHSLLPLFLVGSLGASPFAVGLIDGLAEAVVSTTKLFSGVISDWLGRRKPLLLIGYGLAAVSKPFFPLANGALMVLSARVLDRFGKGIRGAPRDALVADITPPALRGAAYGLRQSMDTAGAFIGPALAIALMALSGGDIRYVFSWAVLPAALSVLTMARFSEAFLLLRGQGVGLSAQWTPLVLIVMNGVYAVSAYPFGIAADRYSRFRLLALSAAILVLAEGALCIPNLSAVLMGAGLWGLHLGVSQGLLSALIADSAPNTLRGTAFGLYNVISGGVALCASVVAGLLWTFAGPWLAYGCGALFALIGVFACLWLEKLQ
jgi:MFS family permease